MDYSTKRNIDFILPAFASAFAGYKAFKAKATWQMLILVIIAVYLFTFLITSQVTKRVYEAGPRKLPGGDKEYDPAPLAARLRDNMYCALCQRDLDIYDQLAALTDAQMVAMYNHWSGKYWKEHNESLTAALADEGGFLEFNFIAKRDTILARLKRLQLS